ncbi:FusB/FusC family EF-G-binding protein [Paenibacillus sp. TRM 82003]|nr:FusB/FusC family EF-G-binding protein [Paenibacillus sp. TRM 82003]
MSEMEAFLTNHQYNMVAQQAMAALSAAQTSSDPKVVEAAKTMAMAKATAAAPTAAGEALRLLERVVEPRTPEALQQYLAELRNATVPTPTLTESELKSLFPKIKKLRLPDLSNYGERGATYFGWTDPGTSRLFLVYAPSSLGRRVGVEGRIEPVGKKGVCAFCNHHGETVLFSAVSKKKIASLPDYYKAVGQYICADSVVCNSRITDIDALDRFFESVMK